MDNKYYIPDIEEFHVGFEFEYFGDNSEETEDVDRLPKEWIKDTWAGKNPESLADVGFYYSYFKNTKLRVKYLDKEDIESLGFELINSKYQNFEVSEIGVYEFLKVDNGKTSYIRLEFNICNYPEHAHYKNKVFIKSGYPEADIEYAKKMPLSFRGNIKNKSELKRLLKQLNINPN